MVRFGIVALWLVWTFGVVRGQRAPQPGEYPSLTFIPRTSFDCQRRPIGYYADPDPSTKCQVYHMCDMNGRKFSYLCPNGTLFHQQHLICAHWYQVNCTRSASLYDKVNSNMFPFPRKIAWPLPSQAASLETSLQNPPPSPPPPPPPKADDNFGDVTASPAIPIDSNRASNAIPIQNSHEQQPIENVLPAAIVRPIANDVWSSDVINDVPENSVTRRSRQQIRWPSNTGATLTPRRATSVRAAVPEPVAGVLFSSSPTTLQEAVARSIRHPQEAQQSILVVDDVIPPAPPRLTMKFPKFRDRGECPHCNPYFIKNELLCFPCVVIR